MVECGHGRKQSVRSPLTWFHSWNWTVSQAKPSTSMTRATKILSSCWQRAEVSIVLGRAKRDRRKTLGLVSWCPEILTPLVTIEQGSPGWSPYQQHYVTFKLVTGADSLPHPRPAKSGRGRGGSNRV